MTQDEAVELVQGFFESYGVVSPGLNQNNFGGAAIGEAEVYFEFDSADQALNCSALIYKFHAEPKPGILESFKEEEQTTETGGGRVDYQPENRGLYLTRTFRSAADPQQFRSDLDRLLHASKLWGREVLERVATKSFHPEQASSP